MKVQDLAYQVAVRTMDLLDTDHHYKISADTRREVGQKILKELNKIIAEASNK